MYFFQTFASIMFALIVHVKAFTAIYLCIKVFDSLWNFITKCDSEILQNATKVNYKMRRVFYYKIRQFYYKMWVITKWDDFIIKYVSYRKIRRLRQNTLLHSCFQCVLLHKICKNVGFRRSVFSPIRTDSALVREKTVQRKPYSHIFFVVYRKRRWHELS